MMLLLLIVYASLIQFVGSSPVATPTSSTSTDDIVIFVLASSPSSSSSGACTDIAICRTRYTIIWSSLVTILACVWTAVHRNVPGPPRADESRILHVAGRALEVMKIVVVTLLVPEWVLAWAVRQLLNAFVVTRQLEQARGQAKARWDAKQALLDSMARRWREGALERDRSAQTTSSEKAGVQDGEATQSLARSCFGEKMEAGWLELGEWTASTVDDQAIRLRDAWTTRHGFFVIMGGFHYYQDGKPQHPLSREEVVNLVRNGDLAPPTDEEIRGWSQGDALSKALSVVQTLWFIVQAIARRVEGLPLTQLEVMTLAYTTITVAMYVAWWNKPQNVGGPVRVVVKLPEQDEYEWYPRVFNVITGMQDNEVDMRSEKRVSTFYGGGTDDANAVYADVVALAAAMVFGAVHCAAWNYASPSHAEQVIWRVSSLTIVALPGPMLVCVLLILRWERIPFTLRQVLRVLSVTVFILSAPIYIAARLFLFALSFTTLRSLPSEAYRAVQWTLRIPHFT
ncbi:hypothetical protein BV25DRAFT_1918167 [Artomyces pyxidatus]|uniref:Uncharacterized protein n=1 Tax=Artomyces pyxidatus TaxID=48021 RepID=A0ACB8ST38_9AGAM|nr:hypothetical protein BV25DRAFT_1918167 [Artomyces pyxidatus]